MGLEKIDHRHHIHGRVMLEKKTSTLRSAIKKDASPALNSTFMTQRAAGILRSRGPFMRTLTTVARRKALQTAEEER